MTETPSELVSSLTDEQRALHAAVLDIAGRFSREYWRSKDAAAEYPWEFVQAAARAGWLGATIPTDFGGAGLGMLDASLILDAICRSGAGLSGASLVHLSMFPPAPIVRFGSQSLKRRFLPAIAAGELLVAFGVTEPGAGSDTSRITTRAARAGAGWVINGQKVWTTNAQNAHRILLLARNEERDPRRPFDGMTLFFAELDRSRCAIRAIDKLGRAAVDSNEVFIDGLEVREDYVVGEVGNGFRHLITALNPERIVIAMEAIGIGRAALSMATRYARERGVFDRPIGSNQAVAHPLADAWARLAASEVLAVRAAQRFDAGEDCSAEANAAKLLAADAGFAACDAALQTHGGFGYAREYDVERLWREVRLYRLAPISQEMARNHIAHHVLRLPRSY